MDLDRERADLNALVREAHEATKDLNATIKAADRLVSRANALRADFERVMTEFEEKVDMVVVANVHQKIDEATGLIMERAIGDIMGAVAECERNIFARFDALMQTVMYEQPGGERIQGLTLTDYIQAVADYKAGVKVEVREEKGK